MTLANRIGAGRRPRPFGIELLESRWLFAFGKTDASFGVAGRVLTPFTSSATVQISDLVVSGAKIVAAGDAGLARYGSDGTLDSAFGTAGKVALSGVSF